MFISVRYKGFHKRGFALKVTLGADFRSKKWTLGAST